MARFTKLILVDSSGQPASARLQEVFSALRPAFRSRFPSIQDEAQIARLFETAANKVVRHEIRQGEAESLRGLAWTALKRQALSFLGTTPAQVERRTLGTVEGLSQLANAVARDFTVEQIEHSILCEQILARVADRDQELLMLKQAGFTNAEIGVHFGESPNTVATKLARLRAEIKKSLGRKRRLG